MAGTPRLALMMGRSRGSLAATVLWIVGLILAASWVDNRLTLPTTVRVLGYVLAFFVTAILWNLDRVREAWRADRADRRH